MINVKFIILFFCMKILQGLELLKDLTQNEKSNLELFCQEKFLWKGEVLFREWDDANAMYILASGDMEVLKTLDNKDVKLWEVAAEEIIWEMAIFWKNNKRMATAIAKNDCVLITILEFSVKELTDKYPNLLQKIQDIIEERTVNNKIIETEIKS